MRPSRSETFVLVHGAWFGAWVWRDVVAHLKRLGHAATAPTLTGLGERRHLGHEAVDLNTHVEDVVAHILMEDLQDITLVGWSYGGMVTTGALARVSERVRRMVYLDAFMPEDGKGLVDYVPEAGRQNYMQYRDRNEPIPPFSWAALKVADPALIAFAEPRAAPQPWRTFFQPVEATQDPRAFDASYIVCTQNTGSRFLARLPEVEADPKIRVRTIDAIHLCMMTATGETVAAITA